MVSYSPLTPQRSARIPRHELRDLALPPQQPRPGAKVAQFQRRRKAVVMVDDGDRLRDVRFGQPLAPCTACQPAGDVQLPGDRQRDEPFDPGKA